VKQKRKELLRKIDQSASERALLATGLLVTGDMCHKMAYLALHETERFVNDKGTINVAELMLRSLTLALDHLETISDKRKIKTTNK